MCLSSYKTVKIIFILSIRGIIKINFTLYVYYIIKLLPPQIQKKARLVPFFHAFVSINVIFIKRCPLITYNIERT